MTKTKRFCYHPVALMGLTLMLFSSCAMEKDIEIVYGDGLTDIDGNVYTTVIIGDQEWLAENLRTTRYNDGTDIPTGHSNGEWSRLHTAAYAVYPHASIDGFNSVDEVLEAFGALYNWYAVESGILCPAGWRVSGDDDWKRLLDYAAMEYGIINDDIVDGAGNALKSCRQVNSPLGKDCDTNEPPTWNAHQVHYGTDSFGFSGLPAGYRSSTGQFLSINEGNLLWNSAGEDRQHVSRMWLTNSSGSIGRFGAYYPRIGASVRCIKE